MFLASTMDHTVFDAYMLHPTGAAVNEATTSFSASFAEAYLQQLQLLQVDAAAAAGISLPLAGPSEEQIQAMAGGAVSMRWPLHKPAIAVPFFDNSIYKSVNLGVEPSQVPSGVDLPFNDIATLRFFFNLGVQQSRVVLLSQCFARMHSTTAYLQSQKPMPLPTLSLPPVPTNLHQLIVDVQELLQQQQQQSRLCVVPRLTHMWQPSHAPAATEVPQNQIITQEKIP